MLESQLIQGIIHVTGEHDTGKTTFALECGAMPERICFFDDDIKGRATVEQIRSVANFGAYHDLVALNEGKTEVDFFLACMELIDSIKEGQFDAIIWDTWTRFEKCMHPYIITHRDEFKLHWSPNGKIKGAEQWVEAQHLEARILNRLQSLAPTVVVVTHLKDYYANDAKVPGKQVPAASRTISRVPRFRIWLRQNPNSPVPIGLIYKRIDMKKVVEGKGIRTVSVLPRKIIPREGDESLWDTIAWYFENPVGLRKPLPEEIPNEFEMSILDETLTREQKYTLELMLKAGVVSSDAEEESDGNNGELTPLAIAVDVNLAKMKLEEEGKKPTPIAIARETGFTMAQVIEALKNPDGE